MPRAWAQRPGMFLCWALRLQGALPPPAQPPPRLLQQADPLPEELWALFCPRASLAASKLFANNATVHG